ncbi:G1 family endopeptidase [Kitasatospora sp. NBC_01250]|uniref:G1 family glutamic endopeptidase n=1 Tax=unclassified Kitasatospora TaxID=2633591 RepID=UPI002E0E9C1C|nr:MULTISPECIES: G1 family glutamic endopeptidase [unclassified Kitasatospora]WSJ67246.1 G1 family endopeptidase [Kitasatospora sp. NBC_01302]
MTSTRLRKPARAAIAALLALSGAAFAAPAAQAATPHFYAPHHTWGGQPFSGDSNWGGYVAQGSGFKSITGSWTMPDVQCNTTNDLFAPWIGIDGYGSSTVEQTGVQADCSSGSPVYSAWYEMYPAPPQYFSNPVSAGDTFNASVVNTSRSSYTLTLTDVTKGWTKTVTKTLRAQNVSAEAVIESPSQSYPSFNELDFANLTVNGQSFSNYGPQAIDSGQYTETPLQGGAFSIIPG